MKKRIVLVVYSAIAVLGLILLLARSNIYVAAAIFIGILLIGHREIWSLIRYRHLPVIDERVRDNLTNAMRLTGIFFFIVSIIIIVAMRFDVFENTPMELIISGQLLVIGIVYVLGYHYYDRVRPNLGERSRRWLKICLITAGLSLSTTALAIALHNLVSYWFHFEDAFFFILALLAAPAVLAFSLLGVVIIYISGFFGSAGQGETL